MVLVKDRRGARNCTRGARNCTLVFWETNQTILFESPPFSCIIGSPAVSEVRGSAVACLRSPVIIKMLLNGKGQKLDRNLSKREMLPGIDTNVDWD